MAARLDGPERLARRPLRHCVLVRPLHRRGGRAGGRRRLQARIPAVSVARGPARERRRLRRLRRHGGRSASARQEPRSLHRGALHRAPPAVPLGGGSRSVPLHSARAGHRRARAPADDRRRAGRRARAPARVRGRARRGRARHRDHHPRPEGAAALVRAAGGSLRTGSEMTPDTVFLPFNRDCLGHTFTPAKRGDKPPDRQGHWLLVQDQGLVVSADAHELALPFGDCPDGFGTALSEPIWLGTWRDTPCWVTSVPKDTALPAGLHRETLVPMQGPKLSDDILSLGGMAMQALWWESTSGHCPRCGERIERIAGEWGKKCPRCAYEHYPHLHPAVITLVRDGDRVLLARKSIWAPGRYALIAGFVDNGESLEGAVCREVKEEVGVDVDDIQYVGSQNWPFPSQLMVGFVARYAGGEVAVDAEELEDARWFPRDQLPNRPSRHSIAGFILEHYARRAGR